jgi:hypothetical protein
MFRGTKPSLLMIELNEFDPEYLGRMAKRFELKNIQRVLAMQKAETTTADQVEHHDLDPWVQWVGIHSGKPTLEHRIRRLGATRTQEFRQIWHAVAELGFTWGVWGAMNAPLGNPAGCQFFMPDPWSFDEDPYPSDLGDLLALPRYAATNYLEVDVKRAGLALLRFSRFFAPPSHWPLLWRFVPRVTRSLVKNGPNVHTLSTLIDYLGVLCFVQLRCVKRPDFSLIFLNHIAHLQHQFWSNSDEPHSEMRLGLLLNDAMLGLLLADRRANEPLIVLNGFRQRNVANQGCFVYRQTNPQKAIQAIGIRRGRVEQCMTHDAHILFETAADADAAQALLEKCWLSDGHRAFHVEREDPARVFYQLDFEHHVARDTQLVCGNYTRGFYEIFELVCERTGAHIPNGDVYYDGIQIPGRLQNHEMFHHVKRHFETEHAADPLSVSALT